MIPDEVFAHTLLQFFEPIRPFLDDPTVSDIMINGPDEIFVERRGRIERTTARFEDRDALEAALRNAAQYVGKHIDADNPILEGRLPDGSRVEAVLPPACPTGPCVSIRRFFKQTLTVDRLIEFGALTPDAAATLRAFVVGKLNIVVAGGTGSGKTSMLNALSSFIPAGDRVLVIEDSREVQLQRPHVVHLEARPADNRGRGLVSVRDLFRATLRLRPDRIVLGEIRGGEALDLLQAMTSGHGGCLATLHATYPRDTLSRLETMALMSDVVMPLSALRKQLASGVNVIVQTARMQDGSRKVTHISEVVRYDTEREDFEIRDIFLLDVQGIEADGRVVADLVPTGAMPSFLDQIREHGEDIPDALYEAQERTRTTREP